MRSHLALQAAVQHESAWKYCLVPLTVTGKRRIISKVDASGGGHPAIASFPATHHDRTSHFLSCHSCHPTRVQLGAFLAGALLAETNYRTQVEADIRPFRGLLLGLFFVTTGTSIDIEVS